MSKEFEVAAKWWADCLRKPRKQDNGDFVHNMMAQFLTDTAEPFPEQTIQKFEEELLSLLVLESWDKPVEFLSVDYGPCTKLCKACERAGILDVALRFPVKTGVWIKPGLVEVSCGYGAPVEVIYKKES